MIEKREDHNEKLSFYYKIEINDNEKGKKLISCITSDVCVQISLVFSLPFFSFDFLFDIKNWPFTLSFSNYTYI